MLIQCSLTDGAVLKCDSIHFTLPSDFTVQSSEHSSSAMLAWQIHSKRGWTMSTGSSVTSTGSQFAFMQDTENFFRVSRVICWNFSHSSWAFWGLKSVICVSASALPFCFPGRGMMTKLNSESFSAHHTCCQVSFFVVIKCCRLLWSVKTLIEISENSSSGLQCSKHQMMANSSLS